MAEDFLRPDADDTDGGWTTDTGGTSLFDAINETVASDADFIQSSASPEDDTCKIRLGDPGTTPVQPMDVMYRYKKTGNATIDLRVALLEGTTEIASAVHTDISSTYVDGVLTLTSDEFNAIGDFTNLFIQFTANPILDVIGRYTIGAAYSLRLLTDDYAGDAVRIRRSIDDAELDVGFDVNGDFDLEAALDHIGGGDGFIKTWYDQSGNALDITQATAANQPLFVASALNGRPTARFDGTNDQLTKTSVAASSLVNSDECTVFAGYNPTTGSTNNLFMWFDQDGTGKIFDMSMPFSGLVVFDFGGTGGTGRTSASTPADHPSEWHVGEGYRETGGTQALIIDGTVVDSGSRSDTVTGTDTLRIASNNSEFVLGDIAEIAILKTDIGSSNRTTVRNNLIEYYFGEDRLLDTIGTAVGAAYSLRKLRKMYGGAAVRVRRASDNVEMDIGFTTAGDFDTETFITFIGASTGAVTTWYDQSGNGLNVTQSTAGNQPLLVLSGAGDKPTVRYDGINDTLSRATVNITTLVNTDECTVFAAWKENSAVASNQVFQWEQSGTNQFWLYATNANQLQWVFGDDASGGSGGLIDVAQPSGFPDAIHIIEAYRKASDDEQAILIDGVSASSATRPATVSSATATWNIVTSGCAADLSELIIFKTDIGSTLRATARADIGAYYFPTPLDEISTAATGAYSTRKLRSGYGGPCMTVRRSSDNDEEDIGFNTATGYLDIAALIAHAGAGNSFVKTWYDQSGNGLDLTQATSANQPPIVASGVLNTDLGGKPSLGFVTATAHSVANTSFTLSGVDVSALIIFRALNPGGGSHHRYISYIGNGQGTDSDNTASAVIASDGADASSFAGFFNGAAKGTKSVSLNANYVGMSIWDGTNHKVYLNDGAGTSVAAATNFTSPGTLTLGSVGSALTGRIAEVMIFSSVLTADELNTLGPLMADYAGV